MKKPFVFILIIQLFVSSCSKNTPPTSVSNGAFQFPGIHISGNSAWSDSAFFLIDSTPLLISQQYDDTLCVPITSMDARLVVNEFDKNGADVPFSDSVIWYTPNNNLLSIIKTQDSSKYLINSNSLLSEHNSSIVVPVYCRIRELISNTMYVQVIYNTSRFNYQTLEFSNALTLNKIKIRQWGREVGVSDSAGNVVQVLLFDGTKFKEDLKYNIFLFFNVSNNILNDLIYASDTLINFNSPFKGTYTKTSNNQIGSWSLK